MHSVHPGGRYLHFVPARAASEAPTAGRRWIYKRPLRFSIKYRLLSCAGMCCGVVAVTSAPA